MLSIKDKRTETSVKALFKDEATYHEALELGYEHRDTDAQIMNIKCTVENSRMGIYASVWMPVNLVEDSDGRAVCDEPSHG